jgi:hypothetical protein
MKDPVLPPLAPLGASLRTGPSSLISDASSTRITCTRTARVPLLTDVTTYWPTTTSVAASCASSICCRLTSRTSEPVAQIAGGDGELARPAAVGVLSS